MSDDVYALIADVLALPGKYSLQSLRAARVHVGSAFQGHDQRALLLILRTLESLVEERARQNSDLRTSGLRREDEHETKELSAIFQDAAFLPEKRDLIAFLHKVLGKDVLKVSNKDSREVVVRKALVAFGFLSRSARTRASKSVRARFIRERGSSLKDWSDIISE